MRKQKEQDDKNNSEQNSFHGDMYWKNQIQEMLKLGYPYEVASSIVSKRKIQELFDKDVKINPAERLKNTLNQRKK